MFTNATSGTSRARAFTLRVAPKKVLAYTQYSNSREYGNILAGINSVSTNYVVDELTDYTKLDSVLSGHDVLLVPEQDSAGTGMTRIPVSMAPKIKFGNALLNDRFAKNNPSKSTSVKAKTTGPITTWY